MTTVGANFVSTQFLANSLVGPVMQAQSQLTTATTEESTGQYADLGLQLGDQSGYELSLKEQVGLLQTLTTGNSVVSTSLSTAQSALSAIRSSAQTTLDDLATWTPSANSGASLQNMGQSALQSLIASTNATSGDQHVFGGDNSSVAPMADYFSTPTSAAKTAIDQAFQATFGALPSDPAAANISASAMQSFLSDRSRRCLRASRGPQTGRPPPASTPAPRSRRVRASRRRPTPISRAFSNWLRPMRC
jgi:flagellar hook-associated protein 3 FlgL